jgi:hypothetical protein
MNRMRISVARITAGMGPREKILEEVASDNQMMLIADDQIVPF